MATLPEARIAQILLPYLEAGANDLHAEVFAKEGYSRLGTYLDLLLRWNSRTNLTSIKDPEEIVRRHFGESLFAAHHLAERLGAETRLLDFGSGAGFPGVPIQMYCPEWRVTLAESQGKKAAFLRETVRTLELETEVWAGRVEEMPGDRRFDAVTLRAVDRMADAVAEAAVRLDSGGTLAVLGGMERAPTLVSLCGDHSVRWTKHAIGLPQSESKMLYLYLSLYGLEQS